MRLLRRYGPELVALAVLWVALYDDVSVANVLGGLVVAGVVIAIAPRDEVELPISRLNPFYALTFVGVLMWKLVESNLRLAWEILTPGARSHTGIFAVPLSTRSDGVVLIVANAITLTPGTLTVDVQRVDDGVTLYVHGIFAHDLEALRRDVLQLESLALRAFGSRAEVDRAARAVRRHDDEHAGDGHSLGGGDG